MAVVGFDFGSQSCYVAVARKGGVETIDNDYSDRRTPTLVAYGTERRFMGVSAKNQLITNPKNTISGFRNLLGRGFADPVTQEEIKNVPFKVEQQPNGTVGIRVDHLGQSELLNCQQVTVAMLTHLKAIAENGLKTKVHDCVISVPSYFTDSQRRALLDSCSAAQLNCLRLMNDTTAAALAYGIYKQDLPEEKEKSRNVVFVDLGYSALQVAVCSFNKGKLKVLAKSFDHTVGGKYFDECLVNHFTEEFKIKYKIDSVEKPRHRLRLTAECEKLKKLLSANATKLPLNIECFVQEKDVTGRMDREEFQALTADLLKKVHMTLEGVLGKACLTSDDIHSVEIIGGSCRIPAVKEIITNLFKKTPSTMLNMDEAVARGCALQCAIMSPTFRVRDFSIGDIQPYAIKLSWESSIDEQVPRQDELPSSDMLVFKEGDNIGVSKLLTFYRKEPFYIQAEYGDPLVVPCANPIIGRFNVKNVVASTTGEPSKLKVKVRVTNHGVFGVLNAYIVEKTIVEEPPAEPETAPAAPTNGQAEGQSETKVEDKQAGEQPSQDKNESQQQQGASASAEPTTTESGDTPSTEPGQQQQQDEAMDTGNASQQSQQDQPATGDKPAEEKTTTGDTQTDSGDKPADKPADDKSADGGKPAESKDSPPEAKKLKKQVKHVDLPVESVTFSLSKTDLNTVMEKEGEMSSQDKKQIEKVNARNAVEEYVYDMRDKLEDVYREFISELDKESFLKVLTATEDWLYEEGEDETKSVYIKKLDGLKKVGNPVVNRRKEFEGRQPAMNELGSTIIRYEKKVAQHKEGNEDLKHIAAEEIQKVEECVQKKRQWMDEQLQKLANLAKYSNPPVTMSQIETETKLMTTVCDPIVNKPKPKVEAPPPPKEGEKNSETKLEGDAAKADASQPETQSSEETNTQQSADSQPPPSTDSGSTNHAQDMDID